MPHRECPHLALFVNEMVPDGNNDNRGVFFTPPPTTKPPQCGPHLEEPLLYPPGTEPYNFRENID